ncbi:MAG: biotin--[acetyl-CoA-carboxylase] ligase [Rickettsiales bacterium]|nr:biotin--[acetyl-CoA-carboxylase] ligase [Rickettsiales bacterium]
MHKYKIVRFASLPSTQIYAKDLAATGAAKDHLAILADEQSAGVGRRGNKFVSPKGNLYFSCILSGKPDPRVSHCVALAASDALSECGVPSKIKWPNDVYVLDGETRGKISGSLTEEANGFTIIGIGMNLVSKPDFSDYPTVCTADFGSEVERDDILNLLLERLDFWMALLADGKFQEIREAWTKRAAWLGKEIQYDGRPAKFTGIDLDGALVLEQGGKTLKIVSIDAPLKWPNKK